VVSFLQAFEPKLWAHVRRMNVMEPFRIQKNERRKRNEEKGKEGVKESYGIKDVNNKYEYKEIK
jgi:hypothetical protein